MHNLLPFNRPKDEDDKKSSIFKDIIVPLGSVLIPVVALITNNTLAWWGSLAIAIYIVIVAIVLVGPAIIRILKKRSATSRYARLEKVFFPKTIEAFGRFKPMVDSGRNDTLWGVWQNAGRTVETQQHIRPGYSHFQAVAAWQNHISKAIEVANPTDIESMAAEIASWVQQFVFLGRDAYAQFESLLRDKQIDESRIRQIKQDWNHMRDEHNDAVSNWLSLCEEINRDFGRNICLPIARSNPGT